MHSSKGIARTQTNPQWRATLARDAVTNNHIALDQAVRTDVAVRTNPCGEQHDDELPDARAGANGGGLDVCQGMDEGLGHRLAALLLIAGDGRLTLGKRKKVLKTGAWTAALRSQ